MMESKDAVQVLQSFSDAVAKLAEGVSQSVVGVDAGRRGGSGVVWSKDGLILTASHVVGRSSDPVVLLSDGRRVSSKVVGRDEYSDVALLKVEAGELKAVERASAEGLRTGQFVLALARAFGPEAAVTSGVVTSPARSVRGWWGSAIEDAVVTDAKLNPGYSGGPLVDASGRMVGMNVAHFAGRGLAVPVGSLEDVAMKISKYGKVKSGFLGVVVEPLELPEKLAKGQEVGQRSGLLVREVEEGSPAKSAGVAIGDVLLRLGEVQATDEYELHKALSEGGIGRPASLWILRSEKLVELKVTPEERE